MLLLYIKILAFREKQLMKVQCHCHNNITPYEFFLSMMVPLLLGFMLIVSSQAYAAWDNKDDPSLHQSPKEQGWIQAEGETPLEDPEMSATLLKTHESYKIKL